MRPVILEAHEPQIKLQEPQETTCTMLKLLQAT